jgi:hypothetical protein
MNTLFDQLAEINRDQMQLSREQIQVMNLSSKILKVYPNHQVDFDFDLN